MNDGQSFHKACYTGSAHSSSGIGPFSKALKGFEKYLAGKPEVLFLISREGGETGSFFINPFTQKRLPAFAGKR
ncbi:MAG: hypothetical protein ABJA78_01975 [Ferruginibacter sp.]